MASINHCEDERIYKNEWIYRSIKLGRVFSVVSIIAFGVTLGVTLISAIASGNFFLRGIHIGKYLFALIVLTCNPFTLNLILKGLHKLLEIKKVNYYPGILFITALTFLIPIILSLSLSFSTLDSEWLANGFYMFGYMFPANALVWVANLFLINAYVIIKQENRKNPYNYTLYQQEVNQKKD